jgi:16S rRNA (adenine1518-N6/adenine1519-N6)-dimethyltransferase
MPRQPLGQHFLAASSWRARILKELGPAPRSERNSGPSFPQNVPWVEIGAGHGEMTEQLATIGARGGARVIAIETDPRLATTLRAKQISGVEAVHADVLTADLAALAGGDFRVYGNLPYYITSPILHHLLENFRMHIRDIHIVIQWEVAQRIAAAPGSRAYGYLSAFCQFHARPEILFRIPPGAFHPPPKVSSALMRLTLPGEGDQLGISGADVPAFFSLVKTCFAHKRKNLRNNLRGLGPEATVAGALAAAGIPPTARAEQIPLSQMAMLFRALNSQSPTTKGPRSGRDRLSGA